MKHGPVAALIAKLAAVFLLSVLAAQQPASDGAGIPVYAFIIIASGVLVLHAHRDYVRFRRLRVPGDSVENSPVEELKLLQEELSRKNEELLALQEASRIVTSTFDLNSITEYLYGMLKRFTCCDRCFISMSDKKTGELVCRYEFGEETFDEVGNIYDDDTSVKTCFLRGESIIKVNTFIKVRNSYGDKMSIPLTVSGELTGVIFLESGKPGVFRNVNMDFLESMCSYAAISILNAELYNSIYSQKQEIESLYQQTAATNEQLNGFVKELDNARDELRAKNNELTKAYSGIHKGYFQTVSALANSIEAMDSYTRGHCQRVMEIATGIAREMKLPENKVEALKFASILHDIGKLGIPASILNKPEKLTAEEIAEVKRHPQISYNILKDVEFLRDGLEAILQHHERYDGRGYPNGLKAEEISLAGRILCLADAFDAMTTDRPYRMGMSVGEAEAEIEKCKGDQFDPRVTDVFLGMLRENSDAFLPASTWAENI